ncbi:MAG: DNA adenine methylase [Chloroflexi bacterium]|nr:DNA adenine methylase [Chloroflexota bacterium]
MLINQPLLFQIQTKRVFPKPFLKWAGGKTQLLDQLTELFPKNISRYCEPFMGSAAVFWHIFSLREKEKIDFSLARLTDANAELVNAYCVVRDDVKALIEILLAHRKNHNKEYYYKIRALRLNGLSNIERAARFIYLNKTCFNGLYRVNRSGQFNVPMGSYKDPAIFDEDELMTASQALQNVELEVSDFRDTLQWAQAGDFIYLDPPYVPVSKTSSFTSYTEKPFGEREQKELFSLFCELDNLGCKVMLSNSWVDSMLELYKGFTCIEVKAPRAINSNSEKRGKISELVVINYAP